MEFAGTRRKGQPVSLRIMPNFDQTGKADYFGDASKILMQKKPGAGERSGRPGFEKQDGAGAAKISHEITRIRIKIKTHAKVGGSTEVQY